MEDERKLIGWYEWRRSIKGFIEPASERTVQKPDRVRLRKLTFHISRRGVRFRSLTPYGAPFVCTIWQADKGQLAPRLITAYPSKS